MLSAAEKALLKKQVEEIETTTSGEIVPLVVERSCPHTLIPDWGMCVFFLLGLGAVYLYEANSLFPVPLDWALGALAVLVLVLALLVAIPRVQGIFLSSSGRSFYVHQRAVFEFVNEGLARTRDRSGVLVFVSKFERRIEILADVGIAGKVTNAEWKVISDHAAVLLKEGKVQLALSAALSRIGPLLAAHFPRKDDDTNELPDDVKEIP